MPRPSKGPRLVEITKQSFEDLVGSDQPLLRLGHADGPGAFINGEPGPLRRCKVTRKLDYARTVGLVFKDAAGRSRYFGCVQALTFNEFKRVGVCAYRWGEELLDAHGNLRSDIEYPVEHIERDDDAYNTLLLRLDLEEQEQAAARRKRRRRRCSIRF
jgi:hypothetical protein